MNRSAINHMPQYYDRYINLAADVPIGEALVQYGAHYIAQHKEQLTHLGDLVYAPGKWTAKDTLQHLIDCERVFAYRALRIARYDATPLPGFEENDYAQKALAGTRTIDDLLQELYTVRAATICLFSSLNKDMLMNEGVCSGKTISVLAIGFTIVGHTIHHMNVLQERYYPLIK